VVKWLAASNATVILATHNMPGARKCVAAAARANARSLSRTQLARGPTHSRDGTKAAC
jgi:hypothetical protein